MGTLSLFSRCKMIITHFCISNEVEPKGQGMSSVCVGLCTQHVFIQGLESLLSHYFSWQI